MNVLLAGGNGMLAQAFLNKVPRAWNLRAMDLPALDITDAQTVNEAVRDLSPVLIINCAAFTRVDDCEVEAEQALAVNGTGAGHLAQAAAAVGAGFVHFSTDYIFDGTATTAYDEAAPAHPLGVYGASKWDGECQVRKHHPEALVIRTQWLYGNGGRHFVDTILDRARRGTPLRVVHDQIGAPTWTEDLSEATLALIDAGATGTYHLANAGSCSWYDFAQRIVAEAGLAVEITPCTTAESPRPARRPAYAVLSTAKAQALLGRTLPPWETALRRFIRSV